MNYQASLLSLTRRYGNGLARIATNRATEPKLDWVVLKAFEKDWSRRYESSHSRFSSATRLGFWRGLSKQVALCEIRAVGGCPVPLADRFDPFGNHLDFKVVG